MLFAGVLNHVEIDTDYQPADHDAANGTFVYCALSPDTHSDKLLGGCVCCVWCVGITFTGLGIGR